MTANSIWDESAKVWVDNRTLEQFKAEKWEALKVQRQRAEWSGFTWDGSVFDSDAKSQAAIGRSLDVPGTINWTLADNTVRALTYDERVSVEVALGMHINKVHDIGSGLRAQIREATTIEQVAAIQWPT